MWDSILSFWTSRSMLQTLMVICLVGALGLWISKLKISRFTLGSTYVFFVGILMAHFGVKVHPDMLLFCQNFGLILFVYALGLQVGPGFVSSLRRHGVWLNLWGVGLILLGTLGTLIFFFTTNQSLGDLMGVLSGAVTNTPALAAAQQSLSMVVHTPDLAERLNSMALGTAITYPIGVLGVIVVLALLKPLTRGLPTKPHAEDMPPYVAEFRITNPAVTGKDLSLIHDATHVDFIISRLWRDGEVLSPDADVRLRLDDHVIVVCKEEDADHITHLLGELVNVEMGVDWEEDDPNHLVSRRILISKPAFNGVKLGSLRLRNLYGVNVTRVSRAEIELLPVPALRLQLGDRLTVVGRESSIARLSEKIGNELRTLDTPYLVSILLGVFLGCLLGSIPIMLPGLSQPIRLGIAGGPIIIGILMGAYGPALKLTTYITQSANLMLRTFGLVLYLACLGLASGAEFFSTLIHGDGLLWLGMGALITLLPTFLIGILAIFWGKLSYSVAGGVLCGAMANPMALEYLLQNGGDGRASVSYAAVYPLGMFVRVILAQLLIVIFLH